MAKMSKANSVTAWGRKWWKDKHWDATNR